MIKALTPTAPLAPAGPPRDTRGMDQDRLDYADGPPPLPWEWSKKDVLYPAIAGVIVAETAYVLGIPSLS